MAIHENMTVGYLLEFIKENNISDDAVILTQRVEDFYFDTNKWSRNSTFKDSDLEGFQNEYHPIWCPVKYEGDNNLYLDLHY